uniref:hypothetical protein n=1 Tax=Marinobacterium profundum TaxID=1714300 RepID=UPI000A7E51D0|nr:hypothetical protein [Marinobacterium profundum]
MKSLNSVIQNLKSWYQSQYRTDHRTLRSLDRHTLKDIGVDPMAAELRRNERLWRDLAS